MEKSMMLTSMDGDSTRPSPGWMVSGWTKTSRKLHPHIFHTIIHSFILPKKTLEHNKYDYKVGFIDQGLAAATEGLQPKHE